MVQETGQIDWTGAPELDVELLDVNEYSRPGTTLKQVNGIVINPFGKYIRMTKKMIELLINGYEYYENDKIVGVDADFAKAIADKLGMELTINDMEFDSIIAAVDSGKADFGAAGMTVTDERKQQVDFSDSYYTGKQMIIVKK